MTRLSSSLERVRKNTIPDVPRLPRRGRPLADGPESARPPLSRRQGLGVAQQHDLRGPVPYQFHQVRPAAVGAEDPVPPRVLVDELDEVLLGYLAVLEEDAPAEALVADDVVQTLAADAVIFQVSLVAELPGAFCQAGGEEPVVSVGIREIVVEMMLEAIEGVDVCFWRRPLR